MNTNAGKKVLNVKTRVQRENIVVSIEDSGPGIPQEIQTKILQPFFTTKEIGKGTGLGLSNVKTTLEKIGGSIKLDKRYDKGARFIFVLKKNAPKKQ